ncbi:MAG: methyltransferase domain-containing protein [Elusimicrobiota bacterium]
MLTCFQLAKWFLRHDRAAYSGLRTVKVMQKGALAPVAADILGFVNHHYRGDPIAAYAKRSEALRILQLQFEKSGAYPASRYAEVAPIDDEEYKLSLLLSFVCTNHRFEILDELKRSLRAPGAGAPKKLLCVGYGTGYELKVARDILPDWSIDAFDNSPQSFDHAADLLRYFKCGPVNLRRENFPIESGDGYRDAFGKIVLCEVLEHLENPAAALRGLRSALHDQGTMFLTMAINIAQEDHIYLYRNVAEARAQVLSCGFKILRELAAPAAILPFTEAEREGRFQKGNYVCVVAKAT